MFIIINLFKKKRKVILLIKRTRRRKKIFGPNSLVFFVFFRERGNHEPRTQVVYLSSIPVFEKEEAEEKRELLSPSQLS